MSTLHTARPTPQDLLKAIDQLDTSELRPFVSQVLTRTARRLAPHLEGRESELLERINKGRSPDTERRYRELIATRRNEALGAAEMEELRGLTEQAENRQAERMRDLLALAQLRGVPVTDLMTELGIEPLPVE
ncbi:MAG: STAS/SEC14 domain-containing protein [bacterium]|nr:STAS/SEC14 domain-containing protein [bacterium]